MNEFEEAMAAVSGTAEESVNDSTGAVDDIVIGIRLSRNPATSGKYMTAIDRQSWRANGAVVAIKGGEVVAGNTIFGYTSKGLPHITPCSLVRCAKCGTVVSYLEAAWAASDAAKDAGVEKPGYDSAIIDRYGRCTCGGAWIGAKDVEKRIVSKLTEDTVTAVANGGVGAFTPPTAFTLHGLNAAVELGDEWTWLADALKGRGKAAVPVDQRPDGQVLLYNPGFWVGTVSSLPRGLFLSRVRTAARRTVFNPVDCDGL